MRENLMKDEEEHLTQQELLQIYEEQQSLDKKLDEYENQRRLIQLEENNIEMDQEEMQEIKSEYEKVKKQLSDQKKIRKKNNKLFVGTSFGFDITEFFKFKKKKRIVSTGLQISMIEEITGSHLSWIILLYSVINAAMIPAWTMNIQATKFLRISWRFLLQTLMMIPFVLYEKRSTDQVTKKKYDISYVFKIENIKKAYASAFATSFYFTIILTAFEWTLISHAIVLSGLANFFLSFGRTSQQKGHDLEPGGQLLVVVGICLVFLDSYNLRVDQRLEETEQYINYFYLTRERSQRILADIVALAVSYAMSRLSLLTSDLKAYYPPFLSMLLVNFFICVNMSFVAFFCNGASFDFQPRYGIFSLFTQKHFAGFMYMAIILCMGLVISFVMISKLFPDPVVPGLAMTLEPPISTFFIQISGVQAMPGPYAFIGYAFIIPGNFLILIGQWVFQRLHEKKVLQEKRYMAQLLDRLSQKSKAITQKKSSIQMKQMSPDKISVESPELKKRSTYNQKYQKNIVNQKLARAQTFHFIPDKEQQQVVSPKIMKKQKEGQKFCEIPPIPRIQNDDEVL